LYLLAVLEAALVWRWRREPKASNAGRVALAVVGGGVLLLPWLPDMVFQLRHTGTPWAQPATFRALVNAVSEFGGGIQDGGRGLGVLFFGLGALGLFGRALDAHRVELDLRTRPPGGGLALVAAGTLALAIAIGLATGSAYAGRYASVVFPLALLLVVLGLSTLVDRRAQVVVVALVVALGLGGGVRNVVTNRTQAGQVASVLRSRAVAGDVVRYCPD